MRAIDRMLLRDLAGMRGQLVTIGLVVACGIAAYVALRGTYRSLGLARDAYYADYRFADVFVSLERAPATLAPRLERVPGVARIETRVVEDVLVPMPDMREPARGRIVSLPAGDAPRLNAVHVVRGRSVAPGRDDEAMINAAFADFHALEPGDTVPAVIEGELHDLRIVGIGASPEYVFPISGANPFPDDERFAVLWMDREVVAPLFDMEGAFDDVVASVQPGVDPRRVAEALEDELEPYGARARDREDQSSNRFLDNELGQLRSLAVVVPVVFLGVAAFLVNVVLSRLVQLQRTQIATLKAFGYADRDVGLYYLRLVSLLVLAGTVLGVGTGLWLGRELTELYAGFLRLPFFSFRPGFGVVAVSTLVSIGAATLGAWASVRAVTRLPPAEAMQPATPPVYRRGLLDRVGLSRLVGPVGAIIVREVTRRPVRTGLSVLGISLATATLVVGRFARDAILAYLVVQFSVAQRENVEVTFRQGVSARALGELRALPGVRYVEGQRSVPVRYRNGHRWRESVLMGHPEDARLRRVLEWPARTVDVPEDGILLTATLAELLHLRIGDDVTVEVLEGDQEILRLPVVRTVDEPLGLQGHVRWSQLSRLLDEAPTVTTALLTIDTDRYDALLDALTERPLVLGVSRSDEILERFRRESARNLQVFATILTVFAAVLAIGVLYNNLRVSLSMRARDLATLRVIGFTRREVAIVLLGEAALQVLLALPPGLLLGYWMAKELLGMGDPELYRLPTVVTPHTYAYATLVVLAAAVASGALIGRQLYRLDLVGVLKTRE